MANWVWRAIILLWAALFLLNGVQGLTAAAPYFDLAGPITDPTGINSVRADFSAFFLVAAGFAMLGVLRPGAARALLVPAALFGTAFIGRGLGLILFGDTLTTRITQIMIIEALSAALMLAAMRQLSRPDEAAPPPADPAS